MEKELKRKLNIFAYNKVKSIEDIDEMVLYNLVMDGAKWMYNHLNPKPIENPINYDFSIELQKYLDETPREKVLKDWEKSKSFDEIGPTVEEFLKKHKK